MVELPLAVERREAEELCFVLGSVDIESELRQLPGGRFAIAVADADADDAQRIISEERSEAAARRRQHAASEPSHARPPLAWLVALFVANLCAFIAMEGSGGSQRSSTLLTFGASHAPALAAGQWWRTVTAVFLHIGGLHLLGNSAALLVFGGLSLRQWGVGRLYTIYLLAGVAGNWLSFAVDGGHAVKAGASGAILGLLGGLAGDRIRRQLRGQDRRFRVWHVLAMLVAYYGFAVGMSRRVDHLAHVGGIVAGALLALTLPDYAPDTRRGRVIDRALTIGCVAIVAAAAALQLLAAR